MTFKVSSHCPQRGVLASSAKHEPRWDILSEGKLTCSRYLLPLNSLSGIALKLEFFFGESKVIAQISFEIITSLLGFVLA